MLARWPAPGRCKSRLVPGVGRARAAAIQARLTQHGLAAAAEARRALASAAGAGGQGGGLELVLAASGLGPRAALRWGRLLGVDRVVAQGSGSLGLRLQRQLLRGCREGAAAVVLIGSDLPALAAEDLVEAFQVLEHRALVLGPAGDGGYWLIGRRRATPQLFTGIAWGSDRVLAQTLALARQAGLEAALLAERHDLDRPADLDPWR
ncbi:TIGR04282 family arsenosugar biosynthesis glycosyltransferase [Cyanobium sp. Cruz CV13-4-11]|jgi:rSAM/selenodomain-associated transferase 1|uniref:TIGR04282 family arsenosugar biosynthesis glycosyltransferase n=1 Tax=unclassified Cyanobium TaxID=2627006 RepID=UPI0020CCD78B|nr:MULTISPECIES: TIGR04282 family arsenosugar biosynthesis glycosyltransferase [unclassified Cyanobium]MCP9899853.1 TIGR04282 family arsenosugar biosynthesis glycosyltransferase [Cyanobium sp. Cruz CV11-17]MCP9918884.1 TIGR04282 family arsenosugar biosynthesis glycosyltransferase [Cyanobium sp. Cruz CV13-4-11]